MKNRLQTLWTQVVPHRGPCPMPGARDVLRRVDAALDAEARPQRRPLRAALVLAAALALLTGAAFASGQLALPEGSVLDRYFSWMDGDTGYAASLISVQPLSAEDQDLRLTVTSSIADSNEVYLTLTVQAKTEEGRAFLRRADLVGDSLLDIEMGGIFGGGSKSISGELGGEEPDCLEFSASLELGLSRTVDIRLEAPAGRLSLDVPVKPIRSVTLRLDAAGPGAGTMDHAAGGPVEVETVTLSPLSIAAGYTTPFSNCGAPLFYFLWQDGTWTTMGQLHATGPSGSMAQKEDTFRCKSSWKFGAIQDITKLEALVFNGTAYPLDGGGPYPVDTSHLPVPFSIPAGEELPGAQNLSVPLFALCEGLGIPCGWDGERAVMRYRDVEIVFTAGSGTAEVNGVPEALYAPALFQDGELWADAYPVLCKLWGLTLRYASENAWADSLSEGGDKAAYWLITP